MSEQPSISYEATPFTNETDVLLNAGDPRLYSLEEARELQEIAKQRHMEIAETPERLSDLMRLKVVTQNAKTMRDYELAA